MAPGLDRLPVIVLNWNGWSDTMTCLESVVAARDADVVWLVDNGSDDDRTDDVLDRFPQVRVLRLPDNFGWAGGYNRALSIAIDEGFPAAYLLNNDTVVDEGFLDEASRVLAMHRRVASVGSLILRMDGSVMFDGEYRSAGSAAQRDEAGESRPTTSNNGSGMLISLRAFEEVGAFEEAYFCYHEEYDWCLRASARGFEHRVAERSIVYHRSEGSDDGENAAYYRTRNRYLLLERGLAREELGGKAVLTLNALKRARRARAAGDQRRSDAILQGAYDGVRRQFGRRRSTLPPRWMRGISYLYPFK